MGLLWILDIWRMLREPQLESPKSPGYYFLSVTPTVWMRRGNHKSSLITLDFIDFSLCLLSYFLDRYSAKKTSVTLTELRLLTLLVYEQCLCTRTATLNESV